MSVTGERVVIAEPHELYRVAYSSLLGATDDVLLPLGADTDEIAARAARARAGSLLLCLDGASATVDIRRLRTVWDMRVVVLSAKADGATVVEALRAGASAFLPKSASGEEILDALCRVARSEIVIHPAAATPGLLWAAREIDREDAEQTDGLSALSPREREIIELLADGEVCASIAGRLFLSQRTVEGHLTSAYRKLGVHSGMEAVRKVLLIRSSR